MPNVILNGGHVVQEVTEGFGIELMVDAAQLTARLQVSSPVKELLWLEIVRQFAIHAKVSPLSIIFRNLSKSNQNHYPCVRFLFLIQQVFTTSAAATTIRPATTEKGELTNISSVMIAGMANNI